MKIRSRFFRYYLILSILPVTTMATACLQPDNEADAFTTLLWSVSETRSDRDDYDLASKSGTPVNLTVSPGYETIEVTWEAADDINNYTYELYYGEEEGIDKDDQNSFTYSYKELEETGYTMDYLSNGTTYYFVVYAKKDNNKYSGPSEEVSGTPSISYRVTNTVEASPNTEYSGSLSDSESVEHFQFTGLTAGYIYRVLWENVYDSVQVTALDSSDHFLNHFPEDSSFNEISYLGDDYIMVPSDGEVNIYFECSYSYCYSGSSYNFYLQNVTQKLPLSATYTENTIPLSSTLIPLGLSDNGMQVYSVDLTASTTYTISFQDDDDQAAAAYSQSIMVRISQDDNATGRDIVAGPWTNGYTSARTFTPTTSGTYHIWVEDEYTYDDEIVPGYGINITK